MGNTQRTEIRHVGPQGEDWMGCTRRSEPPPLLASHPTSVTRLCPGFLEETCGDEIPKDAELCTTHQKAEDDYYWRKAMEQDREEEIRAQASQYAHLRDRK